MFSYLDNLTIYKRLVTFDDRETKHKKNAPIVYEHTVIMVLRPS